MELIFNPVIWTHQPIDLAMNIHSSCEPQGQYHVNLGAIQYQGIFLTTKISQGRTSWHEWVITEQNIKGYNYLYLIWEKLYQ